MTEEAVADAATGDPYEAVLVAQARERSPEAWTAIYNAYYRPLYRYVRSRVFDEAAAADIASSVFVEAISSIDSYRYRGRPLLAWLYAIARNLVGTHRRKVMRGRNGDASLLAFPRRIAGRIFGRGDGTVAEEPEPAATGADSNADAIVDRIDLKQALRSLPRSQREVLALRFFVGLSTPEIAAVMGRQPVAIYSLQARALTALRKQME